VSELPQEALEEARRRVAAARALDMRNNRYGAASAYLAWALEILIGVDPLETAVSLADGATVESLLVGHLPVSESALDQLRSEVRDMFMRLEKTADPPPRTVEAVRHMGTALSVIEQTLLDG
jgi:hypothetical protein